MHREGGGGEGFILMDESGSGSCCVLGGPSWHCFQFAHTEIPAGFVLPSDGDAMM